MNTRSLFSIEQLRRRARRRLPKMVFDFLEGGALDERTLLLNRHAYSETPLRQRVLTDLGALSTRTEVLGVSFDLPLAVSPMGLLTVLHPDADVAVAGAAKDAGSVMIHSPWSGVSLEETTAAAAGRVWAQIAFWSNPATTRQHLDRARELGIDTIVIAGDVAVSSKRERDIRHGTGMPPKPPLRDIINVAAHPGWVARWLLGRKMTWGSYTIEGRAIRMSEMDHWMERHENRRASWDDIAELRRNWAGNILVKGIMSPEDGALAVQHGVDGVFVSNHGGRQFDGQTSSLSALRAVADTLNGRATIIVDGGVRRGSDMVTALAAGADLVSAGRPFAYGLAAAGRDGVQQAFHVLHDELKTAMGFVGATSIAAIGCHVLERARSEAE